MMGTQSGAKSRAPKSRSLVSYLYDEKVRAILYQVLAAGLVVFLGWYLVSNTLENLERQNIATGLNYLNLEASFGISESPIEYSPADTYGRALMVGVLNTLKVAALGIVLSTVLGTLFGVARLSSNWLVQKLATAYVDAFRNIPILLQLFFWYTLINNLFPHPKQALNPFSSVFLSNRGLFFPVPEPHPVFIWMGLAVVAALVIAFFIRRWAKKRQEETGQPFAIVWTTLGLVILLPAIIYFIGGMPTEVSSPALKGFNFRGGWKVSPEFAAILVGLSIYTSTYIAEVVRSGILAVPKGQWEAAESLGLRRSYVMRLIILPQSMRVAIPPLTNQYLNLTKNSSLAIAIGYPDLVSVSNTTMNQTGQAIEAISIYMGVYLAISLLTSAFMNWFNNKMALVER